MQDRDDGGQKDRLILPVERAQFIGQVFRKYLDPVSSEATALALAVGHGVELPHLRDFVGTNPIIHAYDIALRDNELEANIALSRANYHQQDIREITEILNSIGRSPNLIICRAPQIFQGFNRSVAVYNTWWLDVLSQYAKIVSGRGQMLITTYTKQEQVLIVENMNGNGLYPKTDENLICPFWFRKTYKSPNGPIETGFDRYTIVVK